ncbi:hypothetical protein CB0940_07782 [Cercospora beticola]|uniref:J domain-containing protein n=1 Tax=Cercospora beticola TaxID=122368 RepID=A0A2G5HA49_CERBT|nr:hypothetical protein CB0940_07782 [Cercospora beticola]PIA89426.1 hypothetical protein CB0940_07782 [Cercospora beticola]WPB03750.1 hypothetical protein RHO25_008394 [Cercospora beticola]CAK1357486.1 unnamed protein product [Cercospora beticola]
MASNQILSLIGWYVLPDLVTGYVQSTLYAIFIRAGDPKPQRGTPRFARDRRYIHIAVLVAYLLYTIYEADHQIQQAGDFYRLLGVPHNATEKAIQSKFRRLTVQYHPDKMAPGADKSSVEDMYVQLKLAKDTLADPAKRFAYDRLGPTILSWQKSKVIKDFIFTGLQHSGGYYIGSIGILVILAFLGYLRQAMFWRYLIMVSLFVNEATVVTRPQFPVLLTRVVNPIAEFTGLRQPYLPFQMIELLRALIVTFFIALSQLGPLLKDPRQAALEEVGKDGALSEQVVNRLEAVTKATDAEVARLMALELTPFTEQQGAGSDLRTGLKDWLVQNTIRADPEVKSAIETMLRRRRAEGKNNLGIGEAQRATTG